MPIGDRLVGFLVALAGLSLIATGTGPMVVGGLLAVGGLAFAFHAQFHR